METDARRKDWLARWETGIMEAARNRYCDREMGEEIGWLVSPFLNGFQYGYRATGDTRWIDLLIDWADSWIRRGVKEPDGAIGWPKEDGASTPVVPGLYTDNLLGEAMGLHPLVRIADDIRRDPDLKRKYGAKATEYLRLAGKTFEKWDRRGAWRETKAGGVWVVPPFGIDRATGGWTEGYARRREDGFSMPANKQNEIARCLLALHHVTGKVVYRKRAEMWWREMKSRMKPGPNGKTVVWNYWDPSGPWDYKPDGSPKHWVGVHPNGGYYGIDAAGIVNAYENRLVFTRDDIDRLIVTNRDFMWNGKVTGARFGRIDGGEADERWKNTPGVLWTALIPYDADLRRVFEANHDPADWGGIAGTPWYFSLPSNQASRKKTGPSKSSAKRVEESATSVTDGTAAIGAAEPSTDAIDRETLDRWSAPFRGWHYYPDFILPPSPDDGLDFQSTDCPLVWRLDGRWRMWYTGFDGVGYQTALAESDDLVRWIPKGLVMGYGKPGAYDHGGVTFGGLLFTSPDLRGPRTPARWKGKYRVLYGCYPRQGGYELRPGAEGAAWSDDGLAWRRQSEDRPILSIDGAAEWEKDCIYQPWLVRHGGRFYNFYNAANGEIEQTGVATSTDLIRWRRHPGSPILRNRPGGYDERFCSDPKVFRDGDHWVMIYFGVGRGGAHIMAAFSRDLLRWTAHPEPLYKAGGHPNGLDRTAAHKASLVYNEKNDTLHLFYCAVGDRGRGIALLTSKPLGTEGLTRTSAGSVTHSSSAGDEIPSSSPGMPSG